MLLTSLSVNKYKLHKALPGILLHDCFMTMGRCIPAIFFYCIFLYSESPESVYDPSPSNFYFSFCLSIFPGFNALLRDLLVKYSLDFKAVNRL